MPRPQAAVDRDAMIREAAYFMYENNGCRPGSALSDWLAAEAAVDAQARPAAKPRAARR
jgi:hypothetical protein